MNTGIIITILLSVILFIMLYCALTIYGLYGRVPKIDRLKMLKNKLMRRNTVSPIIDVDIESKDEKEHEVRVALDV